MGEVATISQLHYIVHGQLYEPLVQPLLSEVSVCEYERCSAFLQMKAAVKLLSRPLIDIYCDVSIIMQALHAMDALVL